jgi:lipopolysaccharide transport system ATP-binding protein
MDNTNNIAIRMEGVSKLYRLGQIGYGTLQADMQSWWARHLGKEDPNRKVTSKGEGEFFALQDIDLTVGRGETLGIIGRNGSGKSTLLKLISRVTAPTTGTIDIWGRVSSLLEVGTGFNLQMTGRENVFLNGAILGMTKAEIEKNMDSIIAFSELEEFIDTPVKRYSSGMKVKLGFAVAAHLTCEIMIMDEVLAVGDSEFKKKSLARLHEAASEKDRTVLYVSHDMDTVRTLCSRCIVLDKGRIVYDGETEGAIRTYLERGQNGV